MARHFRETAFWKTDLKKFKDNFDKDKVEWSNGVNVEFSCKDCKGFDDEKLCNGCDLV